MEDIMGNISQWDQGLSRFEQKCNEMELLWNYNEQLFLHDFTVDAAIFCILYKK